MGFSPCSYLEHILFIRSVPGFPTSPLSPAPLMWFSLKRTTCSWPKPQVSTGNLGYPDFLPHRSHRCTYVVLPKENHMQLAEATSLDRKSGGAEGSAVPRTLRGNVFRQSEAERRDLRFRRPFVEMFSTERTRISCHAALDMATCAAFVKESRMKIANATGLNRKSGVAQWRDLGYYPEQR
jgi:hypothetical protein